MNFIIKKYRKIVYLFLFLITTLLILSFNKKDSINALVLYKSSINELKPLIFDIKKNTNIKVNFKYIFDDTNYSFSTLNLWKDIENFLSDDSNLNDIDVLFDIPYEYLLNFIKNDKLLDLKNKLDKSILSNTYSPIIDISKKVGNGNMYFLSPVYSTQFIAIDKEFMNLKNSSFVTWDDIYERIKKEKEGLNIFSYGPGGVMGLSTDLEILLMSMSPDFIKNGELYGDEKLVTELKKLIDIYKNYSYRKNYSEQLQEIERTGKSKDALLKVIYPPQLDDLTMSKNSNYNILPLPVFDGFEDTVNIRPGINFSIFKSSNNQNKSLKVLSYLMSKEFSKKIISQELYFPSGEFASYIDDDIKNLYNKKYNLSNTDFIYAGRFGALNKNQFTQDEYRAFHAISSKFLQLMIDNKITIDDGVKNIKLEFKNIKNNLQK